MPGTEGSLALQPQPQPQIPPEFPLEVVPPQPGLTELIKKYEQTPESFPAVLRAKREYVKYINKIKPGQPIILSGLTEDELSIFLITEGDKLGGRLGLKIYVQSTNTGPGNPVIVNLALAKEVLDPQTYIGYDLYQPRAETQNPEEKIQALANEVANAVEKNKPSKSKWGLARGIGKAAMKIGVSWVPVVGLPAAMIISMRDKLEKYGHYTGRIQLRDEDFVWESFVQERNDLQTGKLSINSIDISDAALEADSRKYWLRQLALYKEGFSYDGRIRDALSKLVTSKSDTKLLMEQLMFILGDRATLFQLQQAANVPPEIRFPTINDILDNAHTPAGLNVAGIHSLLSGLKGIADRRPDILENIGRIDFLEQIKSLEITYNDEELELTDNGGWINRLMRGKNLNLQTTLEAGIAGARAITGLGSFGIANLATGGILASDAALGFTQTVINANRRVRQRIKEAEVRLGRTMGLDEKTQLVSSELVKTFTALGLGAASYVIASFVSGLSLGNAEIQGSVGLARTLAGSGIKNLIRGVTGTAFALFMGVRAREEGQTVNISQGIRSASDFFAGQSIAGAFDRLIAGVEGNNLVLMHQIAQNLRSATAPQGTDINQLVSNITPLGVPSVNPATSLETMPGPVKVGSWQQAGDVFTMNFINPGQQTQVFDNFVEYSRQFNLQLTQDMTFFYGNTEYTLMHGQNVDVQLSNIFPSATPGQLSEIFSFACDQQAGPVNVTISGQAENLEATINSVPFASADRYVVTAQNEIQNPEAAAQVRATADFERQQLSSAENQTVQDVSTPPYPYSGTPPTDNFDTKVLGISRSLTRIKGSWNYRESSANEYQIVPGLPAGHTIYAGNPDQMLPAGVEIHGQTYMFESALADPNGQAEVDIDGRKVTLGFVGGRVNTVILTTTDGVKLTMWDNPNIPNPVVPATPGAASTSPDVLTPPPAGATVSTNGISTNIWGANRNLVEVPGDPTKFVDANVQLREFDAGNGSAHVVYTKSTDGTFLPYGIQYSADGNIYRFDSQQSITANEAILYAQVGAAGDKFLKIQFVNGRVNVVTETDGLGYGSNEIKQLWDNPEVHATRSMGEMNLFGVTRPAEYVGDGYLASANHEGRNLTLAGGMEGYVLYDKAGNAVGIRTSDGIDHISFPPVTYDPNDLSAPREMTLMINGRMHNIHFRNGYVDYVEAWKTDTEKVVVYDNTQVGTAQTVNNLPGLPAETEPATSPTPPGSGEQPPALSTPEATVTTPTRTVVDGVLTTDETINIEGRGTAVKVVGMNVVGAPAEDIYILPETQAGGASNPGGFELDNIGHGELAFTADGKSISGIIVNINGGNQFVDIPDLAAANIGNYASARVTIAGKDAFMYFVNESGVTRLALVSSEDIVNREQLDNLIQTNSANILFKSNTALDDIKLQLPSAQPSSTPAPTETESPVVTPQPTQPATPTPAVPVVTPTAETPTTLVGSVQAAINSPAPDDNVIVVAANQVNELFPNGRSLSPEIADLLENNRQIKLDFSGVLISYTENNAISITLPAVDDPTVSRADWVKIFDAITDLSTLEKTPIQLDVNGWGFVNLDNFLQLIQERTIPRISLLHIPELGNETVEIFAGTPMVEGGEPPLAVQIGESAVTLSKVGIGWEVEVLSEPGGMGNFSPSQPIALEYIAYNADSIGAYAFDTQPKDFAAILTYMNVLEGQLSSAQYLLIQTEGLSPRALDVIDYVDGRIVLAPPAGISDVDQIFDTTRGGLTVEEINKTYFRFWGQDAAQEFWEGITNPVEQIKFAIQVHQGDRWEQFTPEQVVTETPVPTTAPTSTPQNVTVSSPGDISAGTINTVDYAVVQGNTTAFQDQINKVLEDPNTKVIVHMGTVDYELKLIDYNGGKVAVMTSGLDVNGALVQFDLFGNAYMNGQLSGTYFHNGDSSIEFVYNEAESKAWVHGQSDPVIAEKYTDMIIVDKVVYNVSNPTNITVEGTGTHLGGRVDGYVITTPDGQGNVVLRNLVTLSSVDGDAVYSSNKQSIAGFLFSSSTIGQQQDMFLGSDGQPFGRVVDFPFGGNTIKLIVSGTDIVEIWTDPSGKLYTQPFALPESYKVDEQNNIVEVPTSTPSSTSEPSTSTPTNTPVPVTSTPVPPTSTLPPANTPEPPTATPITPTATTPPVSPTPSPTDIPTVTATSKPLDISPLIDDLKPSTTDYFEKKQEIIGQLISSPEAAFTVFGYPVKLENNELVFVINGRDYEDVGMSTGNNSIVLVSQDDYSIKTLSVLPGHEVDDFLGAEYYSASGEISASGDRVIRTSLGIVFDGDTNIYGYDVSVGAPSDTNITRRIQFDPVNHTFVEVQPTLTSTPETPTSTSELPTSTPSNTPTPTNTLPPLPTNTTVPTETATEILPTLTPTSTTEPPTLTPMPTNTLPSLPTNTTEPPTPTEVPPSSTPLPTNTTVPTETATEIPPTLASTSTTEPPTLTPPPTATAVNNAGIDVEAIVSPLFVSRDEMANLPKLNIDNLIETYRNQLVDIIVRNNLIAVQPGEDPRAVAESFIDHIKLNVYGRDDQPGQEPDLIDTILESRGKSWGTTPITMDPATGNFEVVGIAFGNTYEAKYNSGLLMFEEVIQAAVYNRLLECYNLNHSVFSAAGINSPEDLLNSFNTGHMRALGEVWQWALIQNYRSDSLGPDYEFVVYDSVFAGSPSSGEDAMRKLGDVLAPFIYDITLQHDLGWDPSLDNQQNILNVLNQPSRFEQLNSYLSANYGFTVLDLVGMTRSRVAGFNNIVVSDDVKALYQRGLEFIQNRNTVASVPTEPPANPPTATPIAPTPESTPAPTTVAPSPSGSSNAVDVLLSGINVPPGTYSGAEIGLSPRATNLFNTLNLIYLIPTDDNYVDIQNGIRMEQLRLLGNYIRESGLTLRDLDINDSQIPFTLGAGDNVRDAQGRSPSDNIENYAIELEKMLRQALSDRPEFNTNELSFNQFFKEACHDFATIVANPNLYERGYKHLQDIGVNVSGLVDPGEFRDQIVDIGQYQPITTVSVEASSGVQAAVGSYLDFLHQRGTTFTNLSTDPQVLVGDRQALNYAAQASLEYILQDPQLATFRQNFGINNFEDLKAFVIGFPAISEFAVGVENLRVQTNGDIVQVISAGNNDVSLSEANARAYVELNSLIYQWACAQERVKNNFVGNVEYINPDGTLTQKGEMEALVEYAEYFGVLRVLQTAVPGFHNTDMAANVLNKSIDFGSDTQTVQALKQFILPLSSQESSYQVYNLTLENGSYAGDFGTYGRQSAAYSFLDSLYNNPNQPCPPEIVYIQKYGYNYMVMFRPGTSASFQQRIADGDTGNDAGNGRVFYSQKLQNLADFYSSNPIVVSNESNTVADVPMTEVVTEPVNTVASSGSSALLPPPLPYVNGYAPVDPSTVFNSPTDILAMLGNADGLKLSVGGEAVTDRLTPNNILLAIDSAGMNISAPVDLTKYSVNSGNAFGQENHELYSDTAPLGAHHLGIDFSAAHDMPFAAVAIDGVVVFDGEKAELGHTIIIRSINSIGTNAAGEPVYIYQVYGHMQAGRLDYLQNIADMQQKEIMGLNVPAGTIIGVAGATGTGINSTSPHLHFEMAITSESGFASGTLSDDLHIDPKAIVVDPLVGNQSFRDFGNLSMAEVQNYIPKQQIFTIAQTASDWVNEQGTQAQGERAEVLENLIALYNYIFPNQRIDNPDHLINIKKLLGIWGENELRPIDLVNLATYMTMRGYTIADINDQSKFNPGLILNTYQTDNMFNVLLDDERVSVYAGLADSIVPLETTVSQGPSLN